MSNNGASVERDPVRAGMWLELARTGAHSGFTCELHARQRDERLALERRRGSPLDTPLHGSVHTGHGRFNGHDVTESADPSMSWFQRTTIRPSAEPILSRRE